MKREIPLLKIEEKLSFNGNEFDLDFCIIYFQIEKLGDFHPTKPSVRLPNQKSSHVILVYKCDGYYKIYDSSMNMIETIWTKLPEHSTFLRLESFIKKMWLGGNIIKIDKNKFASVIKPKIIEEKSLKPVINLKNKHYDFLWKEKNIYT